MFTMPPVAAVVPVQELAELAVAKSVVMVVVDPIRPQLRRLLVRTAPVRAAAAVV